MKKKKCTACGETKPINMFNKQKLGKFGVRSTCKGCRWKENRTIKGVIFTIYGAQKASSKNRGHLQPSYSRDEFLEYCLNSTIFNKIYKYYVDSGFDRRLRPSIDRIDNSVGYSFENIQVVTWGENEARAHKDRLMGIDKSSSVEVVQMDYSCNVLNIFNSRMEAERVTGISNSKISDCCLGNSIQAGGFLWSNKKDVTIIDGVVANKSPLDRGCVQLSLDGVFVSYYKYIYDTRRNGFSRSTISRRCKNRSFKPHGGYIWVSACEYYKKDWRFISNEK